MRILCGLLSFLVWAVPVLVRDRAGKQQFTLVISTDKPVVNVGSDLSIMAPLTNDSDRDLDTSAIVSSRTGIDPNYLYDVRDSAGNPVPRRLYEHPELATGSAMFSDVKPDESVTLVHDINRLFDFSKPGKYVIQVSRRVPDPKKGVLTKSNKIVITVTPEARSVEKLPCRCGRRRRPAQDASAKKLGPDHGCRY